MALTTALLHSSALSRSRNLFAVLLIALGAALPVYAAAPVSGAASSPSPAAAAAEGRTSMYWSLLPSLNRIRLQEAAPQEPQGETIRSIRVEGNETYQPETIKFFLILREGGTFDWPTARADFRTMLNSNFFDDLEMTWERVEGGIDIVIKVTERPVLRDIRIVGTEKEDKDGLIERMDLLDMQVVFDQPIDRQLMQTGSDVLAAMLQGDEGLQFVQVTFRTEPAASGTGVDAVYDVVEGDTVRIENVYFEGATQFTQKELRWMAKKTSEHWQFSFITKNDRYSPSGWEFDNLAISNAYRRLGFIEIQFGIPEVEVYETPRTWPLGPTRRLYVKIPIEEGPQYRLGKVIVEGNTRLPDSSLQGLIPIEEGALFDVKGMLDAQTAMENIYSNIGYFQVQITPVPELNPDTGIADIRYVINENALYTVRRIEFEGNTNTRDYVMRRNLQINENDLWSQGRSRRASSRSSNSATSTTSKKR